MSYSHMFKVGDKATHTAYTGNILNLGHYPHYDFNF